MLSEVFTQESSVLAHQKLLAGLHKNRRRNGFLNPGDVVKHGKKLLIWPIARIDQERHRSIAEFLRDFATGTILQGSIQNGRIGRSSPKPLKSRRARREWSRNPKACILQLILKVDSDQDLVFQDEDQWCAAAMTVHLTRLQPFSLNPALTTKRDHSKQVAHQRYHSTDRAAFVTSSGPISASSSRPSNPVSRKRARFTRLLMVPTATLQTAAASS
jgi:hypothetical protein